MRQIANQPEIVERPGQQPASARAVRGAAIAACFTSWLLWAASAAAAEIVALGASNTAGLGVARAQAYPSQLQAMLRAKGIQASVANAGISGDTSAGMLRRLGSAVQQGTRVVILDPGNNDIKACTEPWRPQRCATPAERAANIGAISSRLSGRGIKVVMANIEFTSVPIAAWQADRRHLTAEGHRIIAARLVAEVSAALGPADDIGGLASPRLQFAQTTRTVPGRAPAPPGPGGGRRVT
jgi:acyl-CoA thioesterase-1